MQSFSYGKDLELSTNGEFPSSDVFQSYKRKDIHHGIDGCQDKHLARVKNQPRGE